MIAIVYLIIPVYTLLLFILSQDEQLPDDFTEKGLQRRFEKIAALIYRKFLEKSRLYKSSVRKRKVREELKILDYEKDTNELVRGYYIRKISLVLELLIVGSILAAISSYQAAGSRIIEDNTIVRKDYDMGDKRVDLVAFSGSGTQVGDFEVSVSERLYNESEANKLFKKMAEEIPGIIKGENKSLEKVTTDLKLVEKINGYPFTLVWKSDDFDLVHSDGKVTNEAVEGSGKIVMLTCTAMYNDKKWENTYNVNVCPKERSLGDELIQNIQKELNKAEQESRQNENFKLPGRVDDVDIIWQKKSEDNSMILLMLILTAGCAIFIAKDKEVSKKVEERKKSLLLEYPKFISRLVLYMGAGMSVRGILRKFSDEYKNEKSLTGKTSFLYEEICKCCNELDSGLSELSVYERFGIRCQVVQYTRLVTLLSQNLKKGNSELLTVLREEAKKATKERMSYARKMGEEAGTKLLLPMVLMLVIVMVVIMIPAYLSF
ncbi:MAG: hypothetical protein E7301_10890 [Butyrivibrio sp.]|nr:hypothetical protein [Butyrivibrio sp.]